MMHANMTQCEVATTSQCACLLHVQRFKDRSSTVSDNCMDDGVATVAKRWYKALQYALRQARTSTIVTLASFITT
jgi:hypothetical protein